MKKAFWILIVTGISLLSCRKNNDSEKALPPLITSEGTGKFYVNDTVPHQTFYGKSNLYKPFQQFSMSFEEDNYMGNIVNVYIVSFSPDFSLKKNIPIAIDISCRDTVATWDPFYCAKSPYDARPRFFESGTMTITDIKIDGGDTTISGTFAAGSALCLGCVNDNTCACCTKPNQVTIKGGVFNNISYKTRE